MIGYISEENMIRLLLGSYILSVLIASSSNPHICYSYMETWKAHIALVKILVSCFNLLHKII